MTLPRALGRFNSRVTNKALVHLVGRWTFAEVEHVGRRSGRRYRTPVNAFREGDRVTIGLTYGRRVDWFRNIVAAGGCRLRLGREVLVLGPPVLVPYDVAAPRLPAVARPVVRLVGVDDWAELPVLSSAPASA
ncbi:nitroreductase family deazaflavin-dependent oxidoreductase [Oryzobacter sp. R7]|uniref:nitroreductase family deazaflavin-dependent oxidoreductase n=1 Tax=Oryzobacter faecalis TaxID=3388656 RepID=UPI00398CB868